MLSSPPLPGTSQVIGCLQYWRETTNTNGLPTTAPALCGVITLASWLKLKQDIERYHSDMALNNAQTHRLVDGQFVAAIWTDVQVGDFLMIKNREMLPADIVLISAHEPDPSNPVGHCHVETKSLDGETNLKGRSVPKAFTSVCGGTLESQTQAVVSGALRGRVVCEKPNAATTKFTGTVHVDGTQAVLSISNVLLRGSTVRNTDYVIGLVVNTGVDTKVMQGAVAPPLKYSSVDHGVNYLMCAHARQMPGLQRRRGARASALVAGARARTRAQKRAVLSSRACGHEHPCHRPLPIRLAPRPTRLRRPIDSLAWSGRRWSPPSFASARFRRCSSGITTRRSRSTGTYMRT